MSGFKTVTVLWELSVWGAGIPTGLSWMVFLLHTELTEVTEGRQLLGSLAGPV